MNKLISILIIFISFQAHSANYFCGSLGTVRSAYDGSDDYISSLVLYNGSVTDSSTTPYNDKYLNIVNADNSVANGYDTAFLIAEIFKKQTSEELVNYGWDMAGLRAKNIEVCLKDYKLTTRLNNGRVEARANETESVKITFDGRMAYEGDVALAVEYLEKHDRMVRYQIELDKHQKVIDQLKLDLDAIPSAISNQLK